jgi:hypothetical protein
MEQTYQLINAILMVHIKSETGAELPPSVLTHIGKFTEYVAYLGRKISALNSLLLLSGPSTKSTHLLKLNRRAARSRNFSVKAR